MKTFVAILVSCLICLRSLAACDQVEPNTTSVPTATPASTDSPGFDLLSDQVAAILSSPQDFTGKEVEIVGYFRGWDLLAEAGGSPPVTRSDWVIKDKSGVIYVTGLLPEGLDPSSKDEIWTIVRLRAIVETDGELIYLKANSVEVINP
ncbi:MAG TPA: hypothetical protein PK040_05600 [Anaerolineaceae bacterium]|nr:hypothetical protein [Anaerolineaceae bacterium]